MGSQLDFPLSFNRRFSKELSRPKACIKESNQYFQVEEILGFEPSGEGEHLYIHLRKSGQNTVWLRDQLAKQLGVASVDIGYAGLKDRHAITTQWFSIYTPQKNPDLSNIDIPNIDLIDSGRHSHKLRKGMHKANRFIIRLTQIESGFDALIESALQKIKNEGFANYFGQQRFGIDAGNLSKGWQLLQSRKLKKHAKKGIYLSSLRSYLFNQVLAARVELDADKQMNWETSGPLWGRGRINVPGEQAEFEKVILEPWIALCEALEYSGLNQERRDLYVIPKALEWNWLSDNSLELEFCLPPGSYATSLMYEIAEISDISAI